MKNVIVDLPIDRSFPPVCQPYRRVPIALEEKVECKIQELIEQNIIEPVQGFSRWVSPLVIISKDNGDIRLCVDMRRANEAIVRENHPIPTFDEILPQLRYASVFTKLDIRNAFHQIEISPETRDITTFICRRGLFRYRRLMFGISCAPEIFQRVMEKMLIGCQGCVVYIDDILIFAQTPELHEKRVAKVMERLDEAGVILNTEKIVRGVQEVQFLGHVISSKGAKPAVSKIEALLNCREPQSSEETRSFLGLLNFIGRFLPNLSTITEPLYRVSRASSVFKWTTEQQESFKKIMDELRRIPFLSFFDPKEKTFLMTDASPVGMGAVLFQGSREHPKIISFASKTLSNVERRYSQTEKEALSIVWGIERFHLYLFGIEFTLLSDHKPLQVIFSPRSKPSARIERWVLRLMPYRYKVVHVPGKENIADTLSRLSITDMDETESFSNVNEIEFQPFPSALSQHEILVATEADDQIQRVLQSLKDGEWSKDDVYFKSFASELCDVNGLLIRGHRLVIPNSLRNQVIQLAHEGHPGICQTKNRLRAYLWWPKMDHAVESFVKNCRGCQLVTLDVYPEPMKRRMLPERPWTDLAVDYLGPLPSQHYIFVVVDYFSRYFEVFITKSTDSTTTINFLREAFARFGIPRSVTADNGPQFRSSEFADFCKNRQIKLINTTPYWPQHNGEVERQNRSIVKRLIISQNTGSNWRNDLIDFLHMYRSTPHCVLKKTPSEMMFGWNICDKLPRLSQPSNFENEGARDRDRIEKEKGREYADRKRRAHPTDIKIGDKVLIRNQYKEHKLSPNFDNIIYKVVEVRTGGILVENSESGKQYLRNPAHVKKIDYGTIDEQFEESMETDDNNETVALQDKTATEDEHGENLLADNSESVNESETNDFEVGADVGTGKRTARKTRIPERLKDYEL